MKEITIRQDEHYGYFVYIGDSPTVFCFTLWGARFIALNIRRKLDRGLHYEVVK